MDARTHYPEFLTVDEHIRRAQLHDSGDEIQRPQQRRKDQAQHAEQPERLALADRVDEWQERERDQEVGGPVRG